MKKSRKRHVSKLFSLTVLILISVTMKAQLNGFFLTDPISYNLSRTETIKQLRLDKETMHLKINFDPDSTNSLITTIAYRRDGIDSALIQFSKNYFSKINVYFSDSCTFNYCKSYFLENFKFSKKQKQGPRLKFMNKEYHFYLTRGIDKSEPKFTFTVVSRKHYIRI